MDWTHPLFIGVSMILLFALLSFGCAIWLINKWVDAPADRWRLTASIPLLIFSSLVFAAAVLVVGCFAMFM